jgi:hypothetical protein
MIKAKIEKVSISSITENAANPRTINKHKFQKLVNSVKEFPEMLSLRPIIVNKDNVILGGNMRYKACKELGLKEVYIIQAADLTDKQAQEFIVKDNVGFGEWDWDILANDWDVKELEDWGLDGFPFEEETKDEKEYLLENDAWFINIEFDTEEDAKNWYDKLKEENLNLKIVQ